MGIILVNGRNLGSWCPAPCLTWRCHSCPPSSGGAIPMVFILCEWRPLELETWQVSLPVGSQPHLLDRQCLLQPVAFFSLRVAREHGTGLMILTPIRRAAQRREHRCLQVAGESPQAAPTVAPAQHCRAGSRGRVRSALIASSQGRWLPNYWAFEVI